MLVSVVVVWQWQNSDDRADAKSGRDRNIIVGDEEEDESGVGDRTCSRRERRRHIY